MAPKVRRGHCSRTSIPRGDSCVIHGARNSRGKGGDRPSRQVGPCTLASLHSLASEMPLTGVQYREKFVEETHRIVYQCTRDELRLWSYIMYRGKISRFMDREYIVG